MIAEGIEPVVPTEMYDNTFIRLQESIDKATKKHAVIAQNIANINNPNYEALEFDEALDKAVKRSNRKVVLEEEMAALSQNSIRHSAYIKLLASKINIIHTVITQGRK
jgi:flagellar basal body rod protein FlgB